ncbi:MAG TPA: sigma 54-interacting transcriptional regulator [Firmicutes bacterium]|nr:sigma 54-interacting transcriptional regulator [Bacillota bacterium]
MVSAKISLIAPYEELENLAREVVKEFTEPIDVRLGLLSAGVTAAERAIESGAQVIISRGGTAEEIRKAIPDIPVVDIRVTGFDLARAMVEARSIGGRLGVVEYPGIMEGVKVFKEMFGLEMMEAVIYSPKDIEASVSWLIRNGVRVIVGETVPVRIAEKYGARGVLIRSGREALKEAIEEAWRVWQVRLRDEIKMQQLRTILDHSKDGIIVVDEHNLVTFFNSAAEELTGLKSRGVIGKDAETAVPEVFKGINSNEPRSRSVVETAGRHIYVSRVPIAVGERSGGAIVIMQDVKRIQKVERTIRRQLADRGLSAKYQLSHVVGRSPKIKDAVTIAERFAATDYTVLIVGETGTGKELFAQGIHNKSARANEPFVAVNCAALPENLLESELFGYKEGAFTGARKEGKTGLFELAHGGTLFLDEISAMPMGLQARLLRVLQEKQIMRLGDDRLIPVNVRIIAASNKDLNALVKQGQFRDDLYYRLSVLTLHLPPLRERKEDIPELWAHFAERCSRELGIGPSPLTSGMEMLLFSYDWPGNVRELLNVVRRYMVITASGLSGAEEWLASALGIKEYEPEVEREQGLVKSMERRAILSVLKEVGGDKKLAAKRLGISQTTLWRRLKELENRTEISG